jgi:hypothetical protein
MYEDEYSLEFYNRNHSLESRVLRGDKKTSQLLFSYRTGGLSGYPGLSCVGKRTCGTKRHVRNASKPAAHEQD